ncbi:hypothetical protein Syun_024499 [Stephania yunnanensis]|uniref:Bacterial Ig-like domain-containing protein n=1 Tax=Stephania yunnanensis TaxID=152371 RepID=A0AAP0NIF4_9MAGN
MGSLKLLQWCLCLMAAHLLQSAESMLLVRFDRAPPPRTRFSTAVFRYSTLRPDGSNPCEMHQECSFSCEVSLVSMFLLSQISSDRLSMTKPIEFSWKPSQELDGQIVTPCPIGSVKLENLTTNTNHYFLLNVKTRSGDTNSSVHRWFIDKIPPTAVITSNRNYTNAEQMAIDITFSEPCTGKGGFKCINTSSCDVMVIGPAQIDASTLRAVKPSIKYSLVVAFSTESAYERVTIKMADDFCTDEAGNRFTKTNGSVLVVHYDRRPVLVDIWTSVPSYELEIDKVMRTVYAANKLEDLEIFLDFSDCVVNSTEEILSVLSANAGTFIPIHTQNHRNRRFTFKLKNISRLSIITVKLQAESVIARSGTRISDVSPVTFLYDATKPEVKLISNSPRETTESNFDVIVKFTKPVFGFDSSTLEISGGTITRQVHVTSLKTRLLLFKEHSRAQYSLTITGKSHKVSAFVRGSEVKDVAGNLNLASNILEVRQYSPPAISSALNSFVTAGFLATSLAAAATSLSSANLGAIGALHSSNVIVSDPSLNLIGMVGHLQVFVLSNWISASLPLEYSETTKGLSWLIPREKLPWKAKNTSITGSYDSLSKRQNKHATKLKNLLEIPTYNQGSYDSAMLNSESFPQHRDSSSPLDILSNIDGMHHHQAVNMRSTSYGLPMNRSEYFDYFLEFAAFSCREKNHFQCSSGGWIIIPGRYLILFLLKWRVGTPVHGILSFPRFELFLLMLALPCICQSSTFLLRGGTIGGIISGFFLLAIPVALVLFVFLFLIVAIFTNDFVQYKEVKYMGTCKPWHAFLLGQPVLGKWFYQQELPSSFVPRFGFLFEDRRGPPVYVLVSENDQYGIPKWINSDQSGIGRIRAVNSDGRNEESEVSISKKLLGCARSAYLVLDLLRRMSLGIISGAYSSWTASQSIVALAFTLVQFLYLFILKPYIRREVNLVECICLLCEAAIFGLSFYEDRSNPFEDRSIGFIMLALLFISFLSQLVNEWYALIRCILRFPESRNPSFTLGLKYVFKGFILPFVPRKYWPKLIPGISQPKTGLVPVLPISPETELTREIKDEQM